jgi:UDP-N-acetyl-D-glucosamine dehydrogenase
MTVGIMGLGYVGLPLAVAFAEAGEHVLGMDVDSAKVAQLRRGDSYIEDVPSTALAGLTELLATTTRPAGLALCDAVIVCVPTPLTPNREPDLSPLLAATRALADVLQPGQLVVYESTSFPGTVRERVLPILEESGLKAGEDFHLAFSPERVDPGRDDYTLRTTPKIVGGLTRACRDRAEDLYGAVCQRVVPVSTLEVAEMAKLHENIFRAVNIAMVNELALVAERMGIDIWEVIDAASTKPFGFMRFDPGPGMGGHCLPVDPFYLSWKAREMELTTEFIELAGKVNQQTPTHCVEKVVRALNELRLPMRDARVCVVGVSYKAGVGDVRESPSIKIIKQLVELGAIVSYHDRYVPALAGHGLPAGLDLTSRDLHEALADCDIAVIVTAHPDVDHAALAQQVPVVDLRGVTRAVRAVARPPVRAVRPQPVAQLNGQAA